LYLTFKRKENMGAFFLGVLVGAVGLFLVIDNNPKIAAKLKVVKAIVKQKIEQSKK